MRARLLILFACSLACLPASASASAAALTFSPAVPVAHQAPVSAYGILGGIACPSPRLCIATDNFGNVLSTAAPTTAAWSSSSLVAGSVIGRPPGIEPTWLFGISCPAKNLCVALDEPGQIVSSTNPAGGASGWKAVSLRRLAGGAGQVSCPSTRLCVAADGKIITSTHPGGSARGWSASAIAGPSVDGPTSVSCPGKRLCVAVSDSGYVFATTRPARGGRSWHGFRAEKRSAPAYGLRAVSCPSTHLCVAVAGDSPVAYSRRPAGGRRAWHTSRARVFASSVSCPTSHLCVAGVSGGVEVSSNPTGGRGAWKLIRTGAPAAPVTAVFCRSARLCLAVGDRGQILSSTHPTGGSAAWRWSATDGENPLTAIACPSPTECIAGGDAAAVDGTGTGVPVLASSTDPAGDASAWSVSSAVGAGVLSCPSTRLCVAGDGSGDISTSSTPAGPTSSWTKAAVVPPQPQCEYEHCTNTYASINSLSCPTASLCAAIADNNAASLTYYLSSTDPAGGASAWTLDSQLTFTMQSVSCPATTLCVAVGGSTAATSTTPTAGSSFTPATIDTAPGASLLAVSCPSSTLCVAVDDKGNVLATTTPTSPTSWTTTAADPGHPLSGVTCAPSGPCVAYDDRGDVVTSATPATPGSWSLTPADAGVDVFAEPLRIDAASCPSAQLCVLTDSGGDVILGRG
jgi:hypothetical protein